MDHETTTRVLDRLFDAALVPGLWPDALDQLAGSLGAVGAAVVPKSAEKQVKGFPTSQSVAHVMDAYVREGWYLHDLRGDRAWPRFARGAGVVLEHDLSSEEERNRLPYYQELFSAYGLPWWAAIGFKAEGSQWGLPLFRDARRGPYEPRDFAAFADMGRHLGRIVTLASRFRQALDARTLEFGSSARVNMITLDQNGLALDISPGAAALVGTDLCITHRRLRARGQRQDRALQLAIAAAVQARTAASQANQRTVVILRSELPPLLLEVITLPGVARDVFTRAVAVVILRAADAPPAVSGQALGQAFGLTPAECRLALLVGAGRSLQQASVELQITLETARTVLKRIFMKVGVSRQAELAALLSGMASR
ncbi:helix-turn-helix transcriptional regulator [Devosia sp.]|uniref:helix-turn-helix transcriptional regulator n=1 Tax=Devosia sp. TaxID=1871048 RepID=UPI002617072B|nr:helix-turn-helix transcriptional regulator [Devosia sp.]